MKYQDFWGILSEIDGRACVIEPENPSLSCNYRRIIIGEYMYMYITYIGYSTVQRKVQNIHMYLCVYTQISSGTMLVCTDNHNM